MLNGYRTLAATGRILGVSAQRVLDFIERVATTSASPDRQHTEWLRGGAR